MKRPAKTIALNKYIFLKIIGNQIGISGTGQVYSSQKPFPTTLNGRILTLFYFSDSILLFELSQTFDEFIPSLGIGYAQFLSNIFIRKGLFREPPPIR